MWRADRLDTVSALVDASALPLSVIIVGVGSEDFSAMEYLDCDGGRLRDAAGRAAARDVVQFVGEQLSGGEGDGTLVLLPGCVAQQPDHPESRLTARGHLRKERLRLICGYRCTREF